MSGTPVETNPYHYTDNDPLNKVDPTGLRPGDLEFMGIDDCDCKTGGDYPTVYFPPDIRAQTYAGYDTEPWYSKGDDVLVRQTTMASALASQKVLPDASDNLRHFLDNTGADKQIKVDKLLREVPRFSAWVDGKALHYAKQAVLQSRGSCNVPFAQPDFGPFAIEMSDSPNWYLAQHGVSYLVQGFVSVVGGHLVVVYQVAMYDPYDWNPNKTRAWEEYSDPAMHGLHTSGMAMQYVMYGLSSDRKLRS